MIARLLLAGLVLSWIAGCAGSGSATSPPAPTTSRPVTEPSAQSTGSLIAAKAERLLGAPYRFGGSGPDQFDCSGLVYFVHRSLGVEVPRTALTQFRKAHPVSRGALQPGDLVFFNDGGDEVTHVGVFVGDGEFVHAPKSGRPVSYARLEDDYYRANFAGGGRLHTAPAASR